METKIGDPEWIKLLQAKASAAKNGRPLTEDELNQLIYISKSRELDPLLGHIHVIFYKEHKESGDFQHDNHAIKRTTVSFQTSIDSFRMIADRTGQYAGSDDPKIVEKDGKVISATVTVYRMVSGQRCPTTRTARMVEYWPKWPRGTLWERMPCMMLSKCAESLALRAAYPQQLSGLYTEEEMDQARPDPRHEDPRYQALVTALEQAHVKGNVFALYLHDQYGQKEFSQLPEESQTLALDALKEGIVTLWSRGLVDNVTMLARSKGITPAQLAEECTRRFSEPAIGKITHNQRCELADVITNGQIVPAPSPTPQPPPTEQPASSSRIYRGQVLRIDGTGNVRCLVLHDEKERFLYFRIDALPAGMPAQSAWPNLLKTAVIVQCELVEKKSEPGTKMLVLKAIEPAKAEQETVTARVVAVSQPQSDGSILVQIEGHREHPERILSLTHPPATVAAWKGKSMKLTLRKTTAPDRIIVSAEEEDDIPTEAKDFPGNPESAQKGASPAFRDEMNKRLKEKNTTKAILALAASESLTEKDLSEYCEAHYGCSFADLPVAGYSELQEKLQTGEVTKWVAEVAALFDVPPLTEGAPSYA